MHLYRNLPKSDRVPFVQDRVQSSSTIGRPVFPAVSVNILLFNLVRPRLVRLGSQWFSPWLRGGGRRGKSQRKGGGGPPSSDHLNIDCLFARDLLGFHVVIWNGSRRMRTKRKKSTEVHTVHTVLSTWFTVYTVIRKYIAVDEDEHDLTW